MPDRAQTPVSHVSVHGCHSGQFCCHSSDTLEDMVQVYIEKGFKWFGITEHVPPISDRYLFEEEVEQGWNAKSMYRRFANYFVESRRLQKKYESEIRILVGFETETCIGYVRFIKELRSTFRPDYIVGSVHFVNDMVIDGTPEMYDQAVAKAGGLDELYVDYFDQQFELLESLQPEVVGHFDLVRIHDSQYHERLVKPVISDRISRNLEKVKDLNAILDFNVRAFDKGGLEPYVTESILEMALEIGVPCVPGDDSHGTAGVGRHLETGIEILKQHGFDTNWPMPGHDPY